MNKIMKINCLLLIQGLLISLMSYSSVNNENIFITDVSSTSFSVAWYQNNNDQVDVKFVSVSGVLDETIEYSVEASVIDLMWDTDYSNYQQQTIQSGIYQAFNNNGLRRFTFSKLIRNTTYYIQLYIGNEAVSNVLSLTTKNESYFLLSGEQLLLELPVETINYLIVVENLTNQQFISEIINSSEIAINLNGILNLENTNNNFEVSVINEFGFEHVGLDFNFDINNQFEVVRSHQYTIIDSNNAPVLTELMYEGSLYDDQIIELSSSANDLEQGDLSSEIVWQSNLDGVLGQGALLNVSLTQGSHTISALVRDNQGAFDSLEIILNVLESDSDNDGIRDEIELLYFSNLDHGSEADPDVDGLSIAEEIEYGLNPAIFDLVLTMPMVHSPLNGVEIFAGESAPFLPEFSVLNSDHLDLIQVEYQFELSDQSDFSNIIGTAVISEMGINTTWQIIEDSLLEPLIENGIYFWRARAQSKTVTPILTNWIYSEFKVNSVNDAPVFGGVNPENTNVTNIQPELSVSGISDADNEGLTIQFKVFDINDELVTQSSLLNIANNETATWTVDSQLFEDTQYYWLAEISDQLVTVVTNNNMIFVSMENHAPIGLSNLIPSGEISNSSVTLMSSEAIDPEGQSVFYLFEISQSNTYENAIQSEQLNAENELVSWVVDNLIENQNYYWRVRASDGEVLSDWVESEFFVNEVNDAPEKVSLKSPANISTLNSLEVTLEVFETNDLDSDTLTYIFEVYSDSELENNVAIIESDNTNATIESTILSDGQSYYWYARAMDEDALHSQRSEVFQFNIALPVVNIMPRFEFIYPITDEVAEEAFVTIQWQDEDEDSNAKINLYAVSEVDRIEIALNLEEDLDGESDQYQWNLNGVAAGDYLIEAQISDEEFNEVIESCCYITVVEKIAQIDVVSEADEIEIGDSIVITASAVTNTGNDLSNEINWTSSIDGNVATGSELDTVNLSLGEHDIMLSIILDDVKYEELITLSVTSPPQAPEPEEEKEESKKKSGSVPFLYLLILLILYFQRFNYRNI